jgi:protein ImuA
MIMTPSPILSQDPFPEVAAPLEEACAPAPRDVAAALRFALSRRRDGDDRPVLMTAPRVWFVEYGRPYGPGIAGIPFILAPVSTLAEALWAMEQGLRSGAVSLGLGAVEGATLAQTRRLDFAAKQGEATGLILSRGLEGLSAARRRWRISTQPGAVDPEDERAPGPARLLAELTRGRGERPGAWMLEQDDETHRLRLADRLADLGPPSIAGTGAPSGLAA